MRSRFNIRGAIVRGGAIRGTVPKRNVADAMPEPVVRPRFRHSLPKLYVGTDKALAKEVAEYAAARQTVPVDYLISEVHQFYLNR